MKIAYKEHKFHAASLRLIDRVNGIITEYQAKGYMLTLRQVYYQLVARDVIPNNERSYKNLGNLISDGRLAGLISWHAIEDRTRNLRGIQHWDSPAQIVSATAHSYNKDKWEGQDYHVEVWVEKDALVGVVQKACDIIDVSYFSCRGYVSQSEMWGAAQRLRRVDATPVIIHLGDHDPSGIDMSRDIQDRLETFGTEPIFHRIALNMDQIEEYGPPPNPTKMTDSRANGYVEEFGHECWELDALQPEVIEKLIQDTARKYMDAKAFNAIVFEEAKGRRQLQRMADDWHNIAANYEDDEDEDQDEDNEE